ncbi:MAG: hypothetical protein P8Y70_01835 [Candidatus Lokiarchaeota archaeon]
MPKSDLVYIIKDNIIALSLKMPSEFQENNKLEEYLYKFSEKSLNIIAGFNKNLLQHFFLVAKKQNPTELNDYLRKLEKISYMIGPLGNLNYLSPKQIEYVLEKLKNLKLEEITEKKISLIADEELEKEFGDAQYGKEAALESQLASAKYYLSEIGYNEQEINKHIKEVREDPIKLNNLFNLPPKEIYNLPPEIDDSSSSSEENIDTNEIISRHIQAVSQDITAERQEKVNAILSEIKSHVKEKMTQNYERVFRQMHPDRLKRACKFLKETKRKQKRMDLYLEWFTNSFLLSRIELKVEHWQVSSAAGHGSDGVYTAGLDFSRYDNIIKEFPDAKLSKVINISKKILQHPSKKAIQKLGQDLIAETGFDEHLYFTG